MPTVKEIKEHLKNLGITSGLSGKRKVELLVLLAATARTPGAVAAATAWAAAAKKKSASKKTSTKKVAKPVKKKSKKLRPSPSASSSKLTIGTVQTGNDGNTWIVVANKKGTHRWKKQPSLGSRRTKVITVKKSRKVRKKSRSRSVKKLIKSKTSLQKALNRAKAVAGGPPLNPIQFRLTLAMDKRSKCAFCKKRIRGAKPTNPENPCNIVKKSTDKKLISYENSWPQNYVTTGKTDSKGKWQKRATMFAMPKMQRYEYNAFTGDKSWKNYHINCLFKSFGLEIPSPFSEKKAKNTRCSTHVIQSPVDFEDVKVQNSKVPGKIKKRVNRLAVRNHSFREKKCRGKSWNQATRAYD